MKKTWKKLSDKIKLVEGIKSSELWLMLFPDKSGSVEVKNGKTLFSFEDIKDFKGKAKHYIKKHSEPTDLEPMDLDLIRGHLNRFIVNFPNLVYTASKKSIAGSLYVSGKEYKFKGAKELAELVDNLIAQKEAKESEKEFFKAQSERINNDFNERQLREFLSEVINSRPYILTRKNEVDELIDVRLKQLKIIIKNQK